MDQATLLDCIFFEFCSIQKKMRNQGFDIKSTPPFMSPIYAVAIPEKDKMGVTRLEPKLLNETHPSEWLRESKRYWESREESKEANHTFLGYFFGFLMEDCTRHDPDVFVGIQISPDLSEKACCVINVSDVDTPTKANYAVDHLLEGFEFLKWGMLPEEEQAH